MSAAAQYLALSKRAALNTIRQPTSVVPAMLFPLLFIAMSSGALNRSISIPGFPKVDSFIQFGIPATIVQGVLFGAVGAGAAMATDIENGFFERLMASPVSRTSILVGRLAGAALMAFTQAWLFLGVITIFGVDIEGGIVAVFLISLVAAVLGAGIGAIAVSMGIRTGSSEAVQGAFPLLFAGLFLSSAFFPRNLMTGWFRSVANFNPLSHLIEGIRTQIITGIDLGDWATALGIAAGIGAFGLILAGRALDGRLKADHS